MRFVPIAFLVFCGAYYKTSTAVGALLSGGATKSRASRPRLSPDEARNLIHAASLKRHVPAAFVKSIMAAESNFYPSVVSDKGAIGLMQLMPATAHEYSVDPNVPEQNVDGGAHYLSVLLARYRKSRNSLSRVIAAYNAGPGAVDRFRGVPPYRETRAYVEACWLTCGVSKTKGSIRRPGSAATQPLSCQNYPALSGRH
jgi:soluble lytic murein transglycosylase-like protein